MQYFDDIRDILVDYLRAEFPHFTISEEQDKQSYCFRLQSEAQTHFVRFMFSAIESNDPELLRSQLERLAVADIMRGLGDFPVVVTEHGCIFGSP